MPKHTGDPLYAMYIQATRTKNGGATERRQWMVFPPLPKELAEKVGLASSQDALVFTRAQATLENRVKWKHHTGPFPLVERDLVDRVKMLEAQNENLVETARWNITPPIVCQIALDEYATLLKNPTTPWFALKRFEKVAKKLHGVSI